MKQEKIHDALNYLDDDMIESVGILRNSHKRSRAWIKWGAMAACLCLVVVGVFLHNQNNNSIAMLFTEAKVIEIYSPQSVLVEIIEDNIYKANTEKNLFLVGDIVQADFNEEIVLQFTAGDIVIIGRGNTARVDYSKKPYIAQCNSIRIKAEDDYRNIKVGVEDGEGAENAGLVFAEESYGEFLSNLPEDNNYRITDYKMLDYLLLETTENSVSGEFSFAVKAVDAAFYTGPYVLSGTGEYEGWLILRKSFTLEHRNTAYWHCIKLEDVALSKKK